ncbi:DoxX family protein [Kineococcus sp. SYSU DK003]|uniref:DoxX family protein n=1 Tax=Kineococcus sp. SYSU DK003 TaxID=3383124 RepID=UPI003D7D01CE
MISAVSPRVPPRWVPLTVLFGAAGLAHLLRPRGFDAIVPRVLPGRARAWTTWSGVAELALAAGYAVPATRPLACRAAVAFLLAVWPANAQMCVDAWRTGSPARRAVTTARLPLQVPLLRAAWRAGS